MNDFDNKQICSYKDIDRFGFTCDVCGRKVNGCHYINGMSFCEKCYQETFGKDNQQNEIQQLKQQLAEKQNTINEINKEFVQAVHDWKTLCKKKDKEISKLQASYQQLETDHNIWIKAYEIALKESGTWWKYDDESNTNAMELYYLKAKELIKNENKINIDKYKFNKEDFIKDFDNNDIKKFENLICKTIGIDNDENKGE